MNEALYRTTVPKMKMIVMKLKILLFVLGTLGFLYPSIAQNKHNPVDYVNVFTGTSNSRWMLGPYAGVPYGMVQLGPDNQESGWMAGYEYSIMNVTGFSHIHAWTMAGLMVMPATQDFTKENGASSKAYRGAGAGFHSRILKESEKASPGYYSCELYDADCKAELTASTHCGFHKYTFKAKDDVRILLVLNFPTEYKIDIQNAVINKIGNNVVEGYAKTKADFGEYTLYFTIQCNKPFKALNGWQDNTIKTNVDQITGKKDVGAYVTYSTTDNEAIMMKVGLSLVDMAGARNNLKTELEPFGWDFEAAVASARDQWNNLLSTIEVKGSEINKEKFYTNFYRSFAKQTWSDVDGRYVDAFNKIQQLPKGGVMYGGDAFWNTFWNFNTILSLVAPDIMNNWVKTELELFSKRSENWKNQFNPELKLQVPKDSSGNWMKNFDQFSGLHWVEGNAWQYTWYVPHDVNGLVKMIGKDLFNKRLEEGFEKSVKHNFAAHAFDRHQEIAFEYYINHGNEGNMQASFLFNYSGKPWLTQKYSRAILDNFYGNTPYHGWEGDEDEGQMGGWFVIASMGLFEMNGAVTDDPTFDLTSPLFEEVNIHIDKMYNGGKPFVIKAKNNSSENIYIQSASLNGKALNVPKLKFKDVVAGGTLELEMGSVPNKKWGNNE